MIHLLCSSVISLYQVLLRHNHSVNNCNYQYNKIVINTLDKETDIAIKHRLQTSVAIMCENDINR